MSCSKLFRFVMVVVVSCFVFGGVVVVVEAKSAHS
jgi:hypothetical protein